VAQFGEGNFLRAFADYMIDVAGEKGVFDGSVAVIKPRANGSLEAYARQDSMYTVILRGLRGGQKVVEHRAVSAISRVVNPYDDYDGFLEIARGEALRIVISNTTEAGIAYDENDKLDQRPAGTFPGKLTQLLYARYLHFSGAHKRGLIILPTELIEQNGSKLRECVQKFIALWELPEAFAKWVDKACIFCDCLVDRIVSGHPGDEAEALERELLGYRDELMVLGEPFGLWVIASEYRDEVQAAFPLDRAGLPVVFTDDVRPYRELKVRLLNGAHTSMVLAAYLMGLETVGEAMAEPSVRAFVERALYCEVAPTVPLPPEEVRAFADSVVERFENPFLRHKLLSIALNSVSKWRARVLPSLKDSLAKTGELPTCLSFSLAALAAFYRSGERGYGCLIGRRGMETYEIRDDAGVLDFFEANAGLPSAELAEALLGNVGFWGEDLNALPGLTARVTGCLEAIESQGVAYAIKSVVS